MSECSGTLPLPLLDAFLSPWGLATEYEANAGGEVPRVSCTVAESTEESKTTFIPYVE